MVRILVVEDEPGIAFSLESDLQTEGYEVALVADGVEARQRALAQTFDLILLDFMLPNKDGFEVCRELRHRGVEDPHHSAHRQGPGGGEGSWPGSGRRW